MRKSRLARFHPSSLLTLSALVAAVGLAGCSGSGVDGALTGTDSPPKTDVVAGSTSGDSSSGATSNVATGNSGSSVQSLPPPSPITGSSTLRLTGSTTGTGLPFTAGYAFRQGDIPPGKHITASGANLRGVQAVVKNRWRDGSAKFAVLSGLIDLQANVEQTLSIGATDVGPTGSALGLASLKATGLSTSISFGSYGTASWSGTDWDSPFLSPISGPEMSSWVYRQAIGSDQHLVAWLEVRLYRSGAVEILPWIENGYLLRPSPGERAGTAAFAINGTTRFSGSLTLYNHTRAVLASGQVLSHWLGGEPGITFKHDMGYLQLTQLVPAYRGVTPSSGTLWNRISTSYSPLGQHDYPATMGSAGYHPSIGPLPEWDVVYMTSNGDPRAWRAVQVNGYAAGRYGFHYRDETTNRAARFSSHPNLVLGGGSGIAGTGSSTTGQYTPAVSGGSPPVFSSAHMPAIGFMAYVVTGRWYFLDEMQLLASTLFFKQTDSYRKFAQGIQLSSAGANTTRGAAWSLRVLAHTAAMTPDDDEPLRSELVGSVQYNVDFYHGRYVAQPNNPLGLAQPYSDYTAGDGKIDSAAWMEDFLTWSFGNIKSLQVFGSEYDAKVDQFVEWKYRSIVGRLGPNQTDSWPYWTAAAYVVPYAPSETVDWAGGTGPWYRNWGDAYAASGLNYPPSNSMTYGGRIEGEGMGTGYWANLQPAIAYAVEHGAPGALDAYKRMVGTDNWQSASSYFSSDTPVWSVRPRNVAY
ncbi:MAG: hypothetical protein EHM83_04325 [Burkholderiales bacterium]|nr:MAG: hypothetical protein EHM83_04325 [Burkholderiales bacterium]